MVRVSKLSEEEITKLYLAHTRINAIAKLAGVTRQAITATLHRTGAHQHRHGSVMLVCKFCGEQFQTFRYKASSTVYCSIPCYNADKDGVGYYGHRGTIEKYEKDQGLSLRRSRGRARRAMNAETGQVVHHIDGNPFNNDISNLMMFPSHAAHMRHHHAERKAKHQ